MKLFVRVFNIACWLALIASIVFAFIGDRSPTFICLALVILVANVASLVHRGLRTRARSAAYDRDESAASSAPLAPGDCVLHGKVVYARGANEAMRMEFVQTGTETESSGSWTHQWKELSRKLTVQPFYLARADGTRVRVEPAPNQSRLFDELESKILVRSQLDETTNLPTSDPVRGRFATLVPDETIWVTGRLARGVDPEDASSPSTGAYRANARPTGWVLVGSPTLLVSSVSLAKHFADRTRRHFRDAVLCALCLVGPLILGQRYLDRLYGETMTATVERITEQTDDSDRVTGYIAHVRHARGTSETDALDEAPAIGATMPFRVGNGSDNAGPTARFSTAEMVLSFVMLVGFLCFKCLLSALSVRALPWYRSDRIRVDEGGAGRLPR